MHSLRRAETFELVLGFKLLADRQRPNALPGRCEDGVDQGRSEGRHARLPCAAWRRIGIGRDDVHVGYQGCLVHPNHREVVVVALLHLAVLEGDLAVFGEAQAHDRRALDLRLDPFGIDEHAAVDGSVDLVNGQFAFFADRHLDDGRDVADEAPMYGNPEPVSLRHGPSPLALVGDDLDHSAQTRGIDRIAVIGLAIVPQIFHGIELDDPRRADELQQHILLIAVGGMGEFGHHRLHRKGTRDIRYRAEPADAGMRGGFRILALNIGDLERHVDQPHAEFEGRRMHRIGREGRGDGWRDAAVTPGNHLAALVEPRFDTFRRDGVKEAVANVVFPRPAGTLHGSPNLGLAVFDVSDRDRRFHGRMRQVRQVVFADDHFVGGFQGGVHVAFLAHHEARFTRGFLEFGPISCRLVLGVGAVVPDDLQRVTSLDGGAGVACDHGDPAERLELGWPRPTLYLHHLLDAGDLHRGGSVERHQFAAGHRRPRDHGILHAGQAGVATVMRGADRNITKVDDADLTFAEIPEVLWVFQLQAFNTGHRLLRRIGGQVAEAETAAAGGMNHLMVDRLDLGCRDAPTFRSCAFKHGARRRADLAHRDQIVPCAARSVGILIAEFDLVSVRLRHLYPRPLGLHFLGDDQRQAGPDTGSHFGAMRHDRNRSIGGEGNEDARVDHRAVRHLSGTRFISRKRLTRHHRRGQHQAARDAEALENAATRNVLDLDAALDAAKLVGICDDVHDQTPVEARWTAFSMRW